MSGRRPSLNLDRAKGGTMDTIWLVVSFVFVFGTIATVAFATLRMFGGGHWRHH
jgi:hypothetical protein